MAPFKGSCSIPEQAVEPGVITVGAKRSNGGFTTSKQLRHVKEEGNVTPIHDSVITTNKGKFFKYPNKCYLNAMTFEGIHELEFSVFLLLILF
jgi:hypothetical protein